MCLWFRFVSLVSLGLRVFVRICVAVVVIIVVVVRAELGSPGLGLGRAGLTERQRDVGL